MRPSRDEKGRHRVGIAVHALIALSRASPLLSPRQVTGVRLDREAPAGNALQLRYAGLAADEVLRSSFCQTLLLFRNGERERVAALTSIIMAIGLLIPLARGPLTPK